MAGGGPEGFQSKAHVGKQLGDKAALLVQQGQQQVGLLNLLIAVLGGKILGVLDGLQGFLGKLVHVHGKFTLLWADGRSTACLYVQLLVYPHLPGFHELPVNN